MLGSAGGSGYQIGSMHSTSTATHRLLAAIFGCCVAPLLSASAPPRGDLMVVATYLPQCAYGLGYEQPLHAELRTNGQVVATVETAGTFTGPGSLSLSFYASDVPEGNYRLHIGRCPALRSDPKGAVACGPIVWFKEVDLGTLAPLGATQPIAVKLPPMTARCLSVATRSPQIPEGKPLPE